MRPSMTDALAQRLRLLASAVSALVLIAALATGWFYVQLRASLPQLDGTRRVAGLHAPVTITRDALGVPTVRGATRTDVARALGFLHAQDRYFQMDLIRRRAAGELAELFGKIAIPADRSTRPHEFRALAQKVFAGLPPDDRQLLESYTAGVNAGLASLDRKPFEYFILRATPAPWRPEDSILIVYAMTLDLQDAENKYELSLMTLRDRLGSDAVAFFAPLMTPDDAALDGTTAPFPPIPSEKIIDLRKPSGTVFQPFHAGFNLAQLDLATDLHPGSNCFVLSGAHTANAAALLANDPHFTLSVPNLWYRAVLEWPDAATPAVRHRVIGVSLPGLPFIVLGSNGHIAWGLTDAYADTGDMVAVDVNPVAHDLYRIPGSGELRKIEKRRDTIIVKGEKPVMVETSWTFWGPIIATDSNARPLAHHWVAYDPAATNINFRHLETATRAAEAVTIAHESGIPAHNFVVADRDGTIAWTIAGKFPKRAGFDGRLPVSWTYGDRRWDGFVPPTEVPTIFSPPSGRLWTANNRAVGGAALALVGDGGFATPPRAAQIRDSLARIEHATPRDLFAIQLDDRALFLDRWQKFLLAALTPDALAKKKSRADLRRFVEHWEGRASIDSVSYRLVREFRLAVTDRVLSPIFAPCVESMPNFDWRRFNYEPALWAMLHEKPAHLLSPEYATWDDLVLAAADAVVDDLNKEGVSLEHATWGSYNVARIHHPFGNLLPAGLGRWLNMPADPLAGDANMPRIQTPTFGASMRLVVSPGHENEALFEMPGGQSGHPLSPFYRAGHEAWVHGDPMPLLPGETQHTLTLDPSDPSMN